MGIQGIQGDKQSITITWRIYLFSVSVTGKNNQCLGAQRAPRNFYSGDQLWGLGALAKILGSPKGSMKFSLEHGLVLALLQHFHLLCFILYYFCESIILSCEFMLSKGKNFLEMLRLQPRCHFTHTYTVSKLPLIQQVLLGTKMSPFISQMLTRFFKLCFRLFIPTF